MNELDVVVNSVSSVLSSPRDRDFLNRVYENGLDFYLEKLQALDFAKLDKVLDAGCGFGQWSLGLAQLNRQVVSMDLDSDRVNVAQALSNQLEMDNLFVSRASIECLPYPDNYFDAVFSFSVIYYSDYRVALKEVYRVLAPGGKVYLCTNSWGWYMYNIIHNHNASRDFSPRAYGIETILNTLRYFVTGKAQHGKSLVTPVGATIRLMEHMGFQEVFDLGKNAVDEFSPMGIYPRKYAGLDHVYELLGVKA